jgi:hypothetical protein
MTQSQKDAFYDKLFAMIVNELKEDEEFLKYVLNNHFGMTKKEVFEAYPNTKNLIVSDSSPRSLLKQKVNANFAEYKERWLKMSPSELIDRCEELEAVTRMAQELPSAVSDEDAEYLLQFKNPLEVVSDEWISRNGTDSLIVDDEMSHLLWSLQDRGDAEQDYEMEPEFSDEDEAPSLSM